VPPPESLRPPEPVRPPEPAPTAEPARPAEPVRRAAKPQHPEPPLPSLEERLAATIGTGEELLREGHYWEAIQTLEPTLPQARGALRIRARLALAKACLKNPKWGKRAEAHLQDVLREDPLRIQAYLLLGDLYREGKLNARAITMYRKVLDLQPNHRHALRQLAELEGAEASHGARGSLLGFLKKR
jgi:tetratricopeptide (TPR) repeat protein